MTWGLLIPTAGRWAEYANRFQRCADAVL